MDPSTRDQLTACPDKNERKGDLRSSGGAGSELESAAEKARALPPREWGGNGEGARRAAKRPRIDGREIW